MQNDKICLRSKSVRVNYAVAFIKRFTSMHTHTTLTDTLIRTEAETTNGENIISRNIFLVFNSICVNALALVVAAVVAVFFFIAGAFIYSLF